MTLAASTRPFLSGGSSAWPSVAAPRAMIEYLQFAVLQGPDASAPSAHFPRSAGAAQGGRVYFVPNFRSKNLPPVGVAGTSGLTQPDCVQIACLGRLPRLGGASSWVSASWHPVPGRAALAQSSGLTFLVLQVRCCSPWKLLCYALVMDVTEKPALLLRAQPTRATSCSRTASSAGMGPSLLTTGALSSVLCLRLLQQATATVPWPKTAMLTACIALRRLFPYKCTELGGWHGACPARRLHRTCLAPQLIVTLACSDPLRQLKACAYVAHLPAMLQTSLTVTLSSRSGRPRQRRPRRTGPAAMWTRWRLLRSRTACASPGPTTRRWRSTRSVRCQPYAASAARVPLPQPEYEMACRPAGGSNTACYAVTL